MRKFCLIMAGGQGTRFWPESNAKKPKQYLDIVGDSSLLSQSLERVEKFIKIEDRYVVTVEAQESLVIESSKTLLKKENIIKEPCGRNTAPCILLSLLKLVASGASSKDLVAVLPSDHVILNKKAFEEDLKKAFKLSSEESMITTIGIRPHFPHTGYGYIRKEQGSFKALEFKEKPDKETAKSYLENGNYLWNAGMFVAPLGVFLDEFESCSPAFFKHKEELINSFDNPEKLSKLYRELPSDSIDYAVMEKSSKVAIIPASFDWNDLGSWDALEAVIEAEEGNYKVKGREYHLLDSTGNIIYAPDKLVALIGVNDLIVVSSGENLLVCRKDRSQDVKKIVTALEQR